MQLLYNLVDPSSCKVFPLLLFLNQVKLTNVQIKNSKKRDFSAYLYYSWPTYRFYYFLLLLHYNQRFLAFVLLYPYVRFPTSCWITLFTSVVRCICYVNALRKIVFHQFWIILSYIFSYSSYIFFKKLILLRIFLLLATICY